MTPDHWRLGTRNPFTVSPPSCDCPTTDGAVHDGDTCQSADSDLESAQGELNEARLWLARRGVDVKAHRSLTWALNEAERAGVVGRPVTEPAGSAVGQRGAPTRDDLVEAFQDAECVLNRSYPVIEAPWRPVNDSEAERLAAVALAVLRDGGADTGGKDKDVADPCAEDYRGECLMPGHDHSEGRRRTAMWTKPNSRTGQFANVPVTPPSGQRTGSVRHTGAADSVARDEVTGIKAVLRDRNVTRDEDDSLADIVAQALDGHTRGLASLSSALGVSLDPDDPDPVGRLVEAAGKAAECGCSTLLDAVNKRFDAAQDDVEAVRAALARAGHRDRENGEALAERVARALRFERRLGAEEAAPKPEVVSGDEATGLPATSIVVQCEPDGTPFDFGDVCGVGQGFDDWLRPRRWVRVLYRAPAPAPAALAVGEVVTGQRAVDAPVGTKLGAQNAAVAAVRTTGGWSMTGMNSEQDHEHAVRINEWVVLALGGEA